jgi:hypothetical protein
VSWVGWRLQRTEALVVAAVLLALVILLVPQGLHMSSAFGSGDLAACAGRKTPACGAALSGFLDRFAFARGVFDWMRLVPGVIGVLLAAPLVLELENGTYRLAWTQGVTRGRLLAAKLSVAVVTALLAAGAFSLLMTWSRGPLDDLIGRMDAGVFDIEGIAPLAWTVFAFGLALILGVLVRRTGVSLVLAFAAYVGCRIFVDSQVRPHYLTPVTQRFTVGAEPPALGRDLVLSEHLVDAAGRRFTVTPQIVAACSGSRGRGPAGVAGCLAQHGAAYLQVVYQPAGRFWLLQGIETAILGGLGLALVGLAVLWLRRAS